MIGFIGVIALAGAMFFSFGCGIEVEREGARSDSVVGVFLLAVLFGFIALLAMLAR